MKQAVLQAAAVCVGLLLLRRWARGRRKALGKGDCVLVTGAARGIGLEIVRSLAERGCTVAAGVRKESDGEAIAASLGPALAERVFPVVLDVSDAEQVHSTRPWLEHHLGTHEERLAGVVCNAGINYNQTVEGMDLDKMRQVFEVNTFGAIATAQALMPLLRNDGGRVVMVGSLAAAAARPFNGAFAASKAALGMLTDALRREVAASESCYGKVHVSVVEPGRVDTPGMRASLSDTFAIRLEMGQWAAVYRGLLAARARQQTRASKSRVRAEPCGAVCDAVLAALTDTAPSARYYVGGFAGIPGWAIPLLVAALPSALVDWLILRIVMAE
eukprot:TRINITY_DN51122_c0_g1_i1.p2 TRINITY_DN51122_c0_g1~~TRINITY_DN51122_c0_g1_i1.p2  ORF type:complete len:330 (+),score=95.95 TRINITY_DN51122_c0_g1_i1:70-1059(+)